MKLYLSMSTNPGVKLWHLKNNNFFQIDWDYMPGKKQTIEIVGPVKMKNKGIDYERNEVILEIENGISTQRS